ncbi:28399_t:CDS:2, partial [Gigaspora margarita]
LQNISPSSQYNKKLVMDTTLDLQETLRLIQNSVYLHLQETDFFSIRKRTKTTTTQKQNTSYPSSTTKNIDFLNYTNFSFKQNDNIMNMVLNATIKDDIYSRHICSDNNSRPDLLQKLYNKVLTTDK